MKEISINAIMPGDIVLILHQAEEGIRHVIGRIDNPAYTKETKNDKKECFIIWGNWQEEDQGTAKRDIWKFRTIIEKDAPGLKIYKLGKWVNGKIQSGASEAFFMLSQAVLDLRATGMLSKKTAKELDDFYRKETGHHESD